jgi:hypothetical protein
MAEIFKPPLIQAQNWQQAQRKFNEALRQISRMLNDIYTGAGIPASRMTSPLEQPTVSDTAGNLTIDSGALQSIWKRITSTDIISPCTSLTISGLNGDVDLDYLIFVRWIAAVDDNLCDFYISPNNDTAAHYGYQAVYSQDGVAGGSESFTYTGMRVGKVELIGDTSQGWARLFAKTGKDRVCVGQFSERYRNGDMQRVECIAAAWPNSADNITSLVFHSSVANGIGIGSHVEIWSRPT